MSKFIFGVATGNTPSVWEVCLPARGLYNAQLEKNPETKKKALEATLKQKFPKYRTFRTDAKFFVANLMDGMRFMADCETAKLTPEIAAEHIIFEGKDAYTAVRDHGLRAAFNDDELANFKNPIFAE